MLHPVFFTNLPSVREMVGDPQVLFVIPTFQRPYAWGRKQIEDLRKDLVTACLAAPATHYFAHLHVVPINPAGWGGIFGHFLDYTNPDIVTAQGNATTIRQTFAVVDGQQRLVTLYLLSILQELLAPTPAHLLPAGFPTSFTVPLPPPVGWLPRIILGTNADHGFFRGIIDWLLAQAPGRITAAVISTHINGLVIAPHCPSQHRLRDAILALLDQFFLPSAIPAINLLVNPNIRMGLTELDTNYALTSFITLNDRGKSLTTLEKLKALWLQSAMTTGKMPLVPNIHQVFGDLYRLADSCVHVGLCKRLEEAEDLLVQLLYHWLDMHNAAHKPGYGADKVYEWFLAQPAANVGAWHTAAQELHDQLQHLCTSYLDPAANSAKQPSICFPNTSTLFCDYHALMVKLGVPHHLMALLLKFRDLTGKDWHQRFLFSVAVNPTLMQPICDLLQEIKGRRGLPDSLNTYITDIEARLPAPCGPIDEGDPQPRQVHKSMLEAVERIAVLAWLQNSNPVAGFINLCGATFGFGVNPSGIVSEWYRFCNYGETYDWRYIDRLCTRDAPASQYYLLYEWERELLAFAGPAPAGCPTDCPTAYDDIELEHILPEVWDQTITRSGQTFGQWGFAHIQAFQSRMLQRIGNKAILWSNCNGAVGNDHPHIKAIHYIGPCGQARQANCLKQIEKLGNELANLGVGPSPHFKTYFELRCAELAAFALKRFCL